MATITFHGAAGTVTGSRHLLEVDEQKILIDCGLFQGPREFRRRNWDRFPVKASTIDRVLLTHAHTDHAGYLPKLVKEGFNGQVHCTRPSADLCKILLRDSAHIQEEDARWANKKGYSRHKPALPLFTMRDADRALHLFKPVHYGERLDLNKTLYVKFKDAGHLLGSSLIDIRRDEGKRRRKILFTGDLGRPGRILMTDPVQAYNVDYLVIESTYGNRTHKEAPRHEELARIINESFDRGGVLVIPAFSVGRTQTLLYVIRELEEAGKIPALPVFVDSPMAINALKVYEKRIAQQNLDCRTNHIRGKEIFRPHKLTLSETTAQSRAINNIKRGAIIISASGMATAGRILHHLTNRLTNPKNTVLFIGYQAEGTRGHRMLEGEPTVKIHGHQVPVKAKIENFSAFSGHADYNEILAWLMAFNRPPERTFIVHGNPKASESLAEKIRERYGWEVSVPKLGESFELDF